MPGPVDHEYPLSPVQQGILVQSLHSSDVGEYVEQPNWYLHGPLDINKLRTAWMRTVSRLESLRTAFVLDGDEPRQRVHNNVEPEFAVHDWRGVSPVMRIPRIEAFLREERLRGFPLETPGLTRIALLCLSDDLHLFIWSVHHVVSDGWSATITLREVFAEYAALIAGTPRTVSAPAQYQSYVEWISRQDWAVVRAYWKRVLEGFTAPNRLLPGRRPASIHRAAPGMTRFGLDAADFDRLRAMARRARVTVNTVVQGAWAVVVSRRSGSADAVFGAVNSGRPAALPGVEEIAGPFLNIIPVRARIDPAERLGPWLADLQRQQIHSRNNGFVSISHIQRWSGLRTGEDLFESMVAFQNYPNAAAFDRLLETSAAGTRLRVTDGVPFYSYTHYPADITAVATDELLFNLQHARDYIDDAAAEHLCADLLAVLRQMADQPQCRLGDLSFLEPLPGWADGAGDAMSPVRQQQAVKLGRGTGTGSSDAPSTVPELFAQQVAAHPDRLAVDAADRVLTFRELGDQVDRLAAALRARGVAAETVVGVSLPRETPLLVTILAIARAGGAFLILDPADPPARRTALLRDSCATLLVCSGDSHAVDIDQLVYPGTLAACSARFSAPRRADLAYVVFTSGSSGRPKGVMIEHGALADHATTGLARIYAAAGADGPMRLGGGAPATFDAFIDQVLAMAVLGHTLVLLDERGRSDPAAHIGVDPALDVVDCATSQLTAFIEAGLLDAARPPRLILFGGEQVDARTWQRLREFERPAFNVYGATECTIESTVADVRDHPLPTVGRPMGDALVYILDESQRMVPPGIVGHIHIGGTGVGRGYLGAPGLTAATFVPDPFADRVGARMYATGDLGRLGPDGTVEFWGRIDTQVKVRGYRIDPSEIENALTDHALVRSAAAIAYAPEGAAKRLVAFVTGRTAAPPAELVEDVRRHLRHVLPGQLIPGQIIVLDELPSSVNGKIDRARLATLVLDSTRAAGEYAEPHNDLERRLCRIWAEVLGVRQVGIHDDFYDLGGHSLAAIRIVARIGSRAAARVGVRAVLEERTVAQLAAALTTADSIAEPEQVAAASDRVDPIDRGGELPESFTQRRLWFLDRLEPGNPFYNVPIAVRLRGHLDVGALRGALGDLVERHEALRLTFPTVAGRLVTVLEAAPIDLPMPIDDAPGTTPTEREAAALAAVARAGEVAFELDTQRMVRARLIRVGPDDHLLALTFHHIAVDGWSLRLLASDLPDLYRRRLAHAAAPPRPELDYLDFVGWQRDRLSDPAVKDVQLAYWEDALRNAPRPADFAVDRPRPAAPSYRGGSVEFCLAPQAGCALAEVARAHSATVFMATLAAFELMHMRYTGQTDVVVGVPVAGRARPEFESMVGFFANTLAMRTDLSDATTFAAAVAAVRDTATAAYEHSDVPFDWLVRRLAIPRDLSRNPLVQVMLQVGQETIPPGSGWPDGVEAEIMQLPVHRTRFDLSFILRSNADGGMSGEIIYSEDLYNRGTTERIARQFAAFIEACAAEPDRAVDSLPLGDAAGSGADRPTLDTTHPVTTAARSDETVLDMFAACVRRRPHAVALDFGATRLTYRQLNARANQLAEWLRECGVGVEDRVAVRLSRGPLPLIAMLGVWKAGAAYLPLDPKHPDDRARDIVAAARAAAVVTEPDLDAFDGIDRPVLSVRNIADIEGRDPHDLETPVGPTHLAYVIYTSGSSGRPKGVMVEHRTLANLLGWLVPRLPAHLRMLHVVPLGFDMSLKEILAALLSGGALVGLPGVEASEVDGLAYAMRTLDANAAFLTPSVFTTLLGDETFRSVCADHETLVISGGELLVLPDGWGYAGLRLENHYGPSETHAVVHHPVERGESGPIPIGRPIPGTRMSLIDGAGRPVPPGAVGEVAIGGVPTGRGYLGRADLTADRFVPDPFGEPGARLYRTGDLARLRPDGEIAFVGRRDDQVKIRGNRVEPGEVRAVLRAHPEVRDCFVGAMTGDDGLTKLVAYLVGRPVPVDVIRAYAARFVPDYMVPSAFVWMRELPLNANGKVDRMKLPALDESRPALQTRYEPPATQLEREVAAVWAEVLGLTEIGRHDDFFALGGHSLLAVRLVFALRERFGVDVGLRTIFQSPTLAGTAVAIGSSDRVAGQLLPKATVGEATPMSYAQQRLWFLNQADPRSSTYHVWLCIDAVGGLDVAALTGALDALAERHAVLRTAYTVRDGIPMQLVRPHAAISVPVLAVADSTLDEARAAALDIASQLVTDPFDLATGSVMRAWVVRYAPRHELLVLNFHHIAVDGWSGDILARELRTEYARRRSGTAGDGNATSAPQYADYAIWQRSNGVVEADVMYWVDRLAGAAPLELTADSPLEKGPGALSFEIDAGTVAAVAELGHHTAATPFMVVLAAFTATLSRWTGCDDVLVGVPTTGRDHSAARDMVGCFVNTLVMRTRLRPDATFRDLLGTVKDTVLDAFAHQSAPFDLVVERVRPDRESARNPLFRIAMAFTDVGAGRVSAPWHLDGLESVTAVELPIHGAHFDVTLAVTWSEAATARCRLIYDANRYSHDRMAEIADAFAFLIRSYVANPDSPVDAAELGDPRRNADVVALGTGPAANGTGDERDVVALFRAVAANHPDRVAVSAGDDDLTFAELDQRSDALASALNARGARREQVVAVHLPRTTALMVTMLAVWKAGGALLLLDRTRPDDWNAAVMDRARPLVVICDRDDTDRLERYADTVVPYTGADPLPPCPLSPVSPNSLAYLIFTSGSTGRPKGVLVDHRSLAAHAVHQIVPAFDGITPDRPLRMAGSSSVTFDMFVDQALAMLVGGHTLVLLNDTNRTDSMRLMARASAADGDVDALFLVTSQLELMVDNGLLSGPRRPRLLFFGAEPVRPPLWKRLREAPSVLIRQMYGLTETAVWSTLADVHRESRPTIGVAAGQARLYVVDRTGRLLPPGATGELCIGGVGVGRGYLDEPGLTADRFVPDPFTPVLGARMLRTGDRGRMHADGRIDLLGRTDAQLKVRGFLVEPAEVEDALHSHPDVGQAVVVGTGRNGVTDGLVGFVTAAGGRPPTPEGIRLALGSRLPAHLVPNRIVVVDALPSTSSGKVDRLKLANRAAGLSSATNHYTAPRTDLERDLADTWAQTLGLPRVGVFDDFFEIGGHSLLAVRLLFALRERFGVDIGLHAVLSGRTVAAVAAAVQSSPLGHHSHLTELAAGGSGQPVVFVHPLGGELNCYASLVAAMPPDRPVYGVRAAAIPIDAGDVAELAARYVREIRSALDGRSVTVAGWSFGGVLAFEIATQLHELDVDVSLAMIDTDLPAERSPYHFGRLVDGLRDFRARLARDGANAVDGEDSRRLFVSLGIWPADLRALPADYLDPLVGSWLRLVEAAHGYRPRPCRIPATAFVGRDARPGLADAIRQHVPGARVVPVRVGHIEMLSPPTVTRLAAAIAALASMPPNGAISGREGERQPTLKGAT